MGDRRLETRGKRRETEDGRTGTRDKRQKIGDGIQRRRETEDRDRRLKTGE